MKYLPRKRCTRLSLIAILDKSHSGWPGAPHPRLSRFTPGVSPITVKDGGQSLARVEGVDPLWCWAHIRRYFIRAGDARAQLRYWRDRWAALIADLYLAHRAMAAAGPATADYATAHARFGQALAAIGTARTQPRGPGLHPAARKVLATLDREREGLARHRDFPDLDLDNNQSERALRTPVAGRKNYYGSHAEWSAHLAARVWTITATAERHHHEPLAYLTSYLDACASAGGKPPEGQCPAPVPALDPQPGRQPRPRPPGHQPARLTRTGPGQSRAEPLTRLSTRPGPPPCQPTGSPNTYGLLNSPR